VTNIASRDGSYDVVFDFFTLDHVEDWRRGISEISRVLKPGGFFAFSELYDNAVRNYLLRNIRPKEDRFDRQELVKSLAESRMRLMERQNGMYGYGLAGVARKN
jgi:ubiquinone/menaquinone biosynthesis C-methylase UbiE